MDDNEVLAAALDMAAVAPERYGSFLDEVAQDSPEYAAELAAAVGNTLSQIAASTSEAEFQEAYAASEQANIEHAQAVLDAVAGKRGMSSADVERTAAAYRDATGSTTLRGDLLAVMPEDREAFVREISIAAEVDQRADRMKRFVGSFFTGGTNIEDGLTIRGQRAGGDLPPVLFDDDYHHYKIEQQVRREDEQRQGERRAEVEDAASIKRQLLTPDGNDWRQGLTDGAGRRTTYERIAESDPDSSLNCQRRQREAELRKITNLTGAKRIP